MPDISVIICTHNPRPDYLRRVVDALKAQTLPKEQWELLLIDNASKEPLADSWDLSWHPHARHIREDELGLTPARLRGIKESTGELLVFVDDDNVLDPDYLEIALGIEHTYPFIAVWGGSIKGEFESEPSAAVRPFLSLLAIKETLRDWWANARSSDEATPAGAGICATRSAVVHYLTELKRNPKRACLDRQGTSLISGGDTDLAWTACNMGLGMGRFAALKLTHLIPAARVQEEYVLQLFEGLHYSSLLLRHLHGETVSVPVRSLKSRIRHRLGLVFLNGFEKRVRMAHWKAQERFYRFLQDGNITDNGGSHGR